MSYKTLAVELKDGRVHPSGAEPLPSHAHALLTILTLASPASPNLANGSPAERGGIVLTCAELADRWESLPKLPPEEASALADDLETAHRNLPPLKPAWD